MTLGQPDVYEAFRNCGRRAEMNRYQQVVMKFGREAQAAGYPASGAAWLCPAGFAR